MEEQFVTYEIALKLKELGFDEEVLATYDTDKLDTKNDLKIFAFSVPNKGIFEEGFKRGWCIKAPLWQQVIDWFRENHQILTNPLIEIKGVYSWVIAWPISSYEVETEHIQAENWYRAREYAILKAIELCKNKK